MAVRRSALEDNVFTLTQPGVSDSLTYQIARKQALLSQLQSELQLLSVSPSVSYPDLSSHHYQTLVSDL